jgi:dCMP deaminase
MPLIYKDGVPANTHPLNLVEVPDDFVASPDGVTRPPLYEVYMRMAEELANRSTCSRLQVGTVLTDSSLEHVVAIGYNGNVRGFPNRCDSDEVGRCGCIHSEMNALVKSPGDLPDKVAFVTASPCIMCAKLMVQAKVSHLFYRRAYRDPAGLDVLDRAGVVTIQYTRWQNAWREG